MKANLLIPGFVLSMLCAWLHAQEAEERTAEYWIEQLKDKASPDRSLAARELGRKGQGNRQALNALRTATYDHDEQVRCAAVAALGQFGAEGLAELEAAYFGPPRVRERLVEAFAKIGETSRDAVPYLARLAADKDEEVRKQAEAALERLDIPKNRIVPALLEFLKSGADAKVSETAAKALGEMKAVEAVPALTEGLKAENWRVRSSCAEALGLFGPQADSAVPALAEALDDRSDPVRYRVATALSRMGPAAKAAVPALLSALKNRNGSSANNLLALSHLVGPENTDAVPALAEAIDDKITGSAAVMALGRIGPGAEGVIPALAKALENRQTAGMAVRTLHGFGAKAAPAIPGLIEALKNPEPSVRSQAAQTLGLIGPDARVAIPALIAASGDTARNVRDVIMQTLITFDVSEEQIIKSLCESLHHADATRRLGAVAALGAFGPKSGEAVPGLLAVLNSKQEHGGTRAASALALADIAPKHEKVIAALQATLSDPAPAIREAAAEAIGRCGAAARPAMPALIVAASKDENERVRAEAAKSLPRISPDDETLVDLLIDALRDKDAALRIGAIKLMGRIVRPQMTEAGNAINALEHAQNDKDPDVARAAGDALRVINARE